MEPEFRLADPRRPAGVDDMADIPWTTLVWRSMQASYRDLSGKEARQNSQMEGLVEALVQIAEQVYALRKMIGHPQSSAPQAAPSSGGPGLGPGIWDRVDRIGRAVSDADVRILAPEGEPYVAELMEVLENRAQKPDPMAQGPYVNEILAPAILFGGQVRRMGQAVIGVPVHPFGKEAPNPAVNAPGKVEAE